MATIEYMLNNKKVSYPDFLEFVKSNPLKEFLHHFQYPFLVGNDLYAGEMEDGNSGVDGTVQFVGGVDKAMAQASSALNKFVSRSLFYLQHNSRNPGGVQLFHVGRTIKSDINIVDYTISKSHAFITYDGGKYYLKDIGATNGTCLNGETLEKDEPHLLNARDKVKLGRFEFVFLPPLELYLKTRTSKSMENSLEDELAGIVRFASARVLNTIARKHKLNTEGLSRTELREKLLADIRPLDILLELF